MKKHILLFVLCTIVLTSTSNIHGMFATISRRFVGQNRLAGGARQYSSRISLWWSNFKDFMNDWSQSPQVRNAQRATERAEQAEKMKRAERYVEIQRTRSQKELSEIESKQKEMTELIEKSHQARITQARKEAEDERSRKLLEKVRSIKE